MKKYTTPEIMISAFVKEDIMTASQTTVIWNDDAGEYLVGAASDWWSP